MKIRAFLVPTKTIENLWVSNVKGVRGLSRYSFNMMSYCFSVIFSFSRDSLKVYSMGPSFRPQKT